MSAHPNRMQLRKVILIRDTGLGVQIGTSGWQNPVTVTGDLANILRFIFEVAPEPEPVADDAA